MKEAKALIEKYKAGTCTPEEMRLIDKWLLEIHMGERSELSAADFEEISNEVWQGVLASRIQEPVKTVRLWPRIAVAAAAVAAITLGVWFYYTPSINGRHSDAGQNPALAMNDIAPGKNGATITLANGKVIELSDAKSGVIVGKDLKYDDGTDLSGSRNEFGTGSRTIQILTASTARGQTYQFTLPDGTRVWLNADSKISFPSQFSGAERKILLSGEGYFEVVHNAKQPFRVVSRGQVVEDIGTAFNINAYGDELSVRTTLVEGSAVVSPLSPQGGSLPVAERKILKPNQQSVLTGSNKITVKEVDVNTVVDWKVGEFVFKSQTISDMMRKVQRWYDIEVIYQSEVIKQRKFTADISRYDNISSLLDILERTEQVHFKVEGRKVYVSQ